MSSFAGARKCWQKAPPDERALARYEADCICVRENGDAVAIRQVISYLGEVPV